MVYEEVHSLDCAERLQGKLITDPKGEVER